MHSAPRQVLVNARQSNRHAHHTRFPFPESHLAEFATQPYIHNCLVTVQEGFHEYRFMVFFKRHVLLRKNKCLSTLVRGVAPICKGDVLVMRLGSLAAYVNMRDRDTILADWLVRR